MNDLLARILAYVSTIDPLTLIPFAVLAIVYLVRRNFHDQWERYADLVLLVFGDDAELDRLFLLARKAWQALPSAVIGAILAAVFAHADIGTAIAGAGVSVAAPVFYEIQKWFRGLVARFLARGKSPAGTSHTGIVFLIFGLSLLPVSLTLVSCKQSQIDSALDVASDVFEVARALCIGAAKDRVGLSAGEALSKFCDTREKLEPWVFLAREAQRVGATKTGMTPSDPHVEE
jgi:hypothetical protein